MSTPGGYSCAVTGFAGMEPEILRLRNTNRANPETLEYLSWRYGGVAGMPPASVHWLLDAGGARVGMAAVIFRPYRIEGAPVPVAVVGDISVDASLRGQGLGRLLLGSMTQYLAEQLPQHPALVIPTRSARAALAGAGWHSGGELAPLVCVLDPSAYVRRALRSKALTALAARALRALMRMRVRRTGLAGTTLRVADSPDAPLRDFAARLAPGAGIVRDTGPDFLAWRYTQHPHLHFRFATLTRAGAVKAFLVFEERAHPGVCSVFDLRGESREELRALLALFVLRGLATPGLASVRVLLDATHPAREPLRSAGFIARPADAVFQVYPGGAAAGAAQWRITQGDKDI